MSWVESCHYILMYIDRFNTSDQKCQKGFYRIRKIDSEIYMGE